MIHRSQKQRAKKYGETIPYTADELIAHCLPILEAPCTYCGEKLTPGGFQIDHVQPIKRGGAWALSNTAPICTPCNRRKGALTDSEYRKLIEFIRANFDSFVQMNILSRLAAGGAWLAARF